MLTLCCCIHATTHHILTAGDAVPPVIIVHPRMEVAYKTGDRVLLECEASGSPNPT